MIIPLTIINELILVMDTCGIYSEAESQHLNTI
jgi:hypothetical protein